MPVLRVPLTQTRCGWVAVLNNCPSKPSAFALFAVGLFLAACSTSEPLDSAGATPSPGSAAAFYVSPSGSDANTGTVDAPFGTLARAQAAMRMSMAKIAYLRAGTYSSVSLTLTSSDDNETWSYYAPDGYNSAILDGGANGPGTGQNVITILGTSGLTIDGLQIQNFQQWGIGIHGGESDATAGFPSDAPNVEGVRLLNNIITNGYTTANHSWAGGGVWGDGQVTNLTVANNVITNQYGSAIRVVSFAGAAQPSNVFTGLTIENNVALNTNIVTGDNGTIYIEDILSLSRDITITNNFIRDYQNVPSLRNGMTPIRDVAVFLDEGAQYVTVSGNIIAATANSYTASAVTDSPCAFFLSSANHVTISGNIVDLGAAGLILNMGYLMYGPSFPPMSSNVIERNIFVGSWSGIQQSYGIGQGPFAYASGGPTPPLQPTITNNLYYNYGTGSLATTGNAFSDSSPITDENVLVSGWTYSLASNSPAFDAPVNFTPILGMWGPPGYIIPETGTPPSTASSQ